VRRVAVWHIFDDPVNLSYKVTSFIYELKLTTVFLFVPDGKSCAAQISYDPLLLQVSRLKQAKHTSLKTFASEPAPVKPDLSYAFFAYERRAKPPEIEVRV
jgi:hypothetical protein